MHLLVNLLALGLLCCRLVSQPPLTPGRNAYIPSLCYMRLNFPSELVNQAEMQILK